MKMKLFKFLDKFDILSRVIVSAYVILLRYTEDGLHSFAKKTASQAK